jgi:signal transduction histidine kinase
MYLDEVIEEVVRAARVLAARTQVGIEVRAAGSAAFTGDEELVRRLIVNLLDNAVRHAPAGTSVVVELQPQGDGYAISISDRGSGIPAAIQPHLFERFYRGDDARARTDGGGGGAGLGLALARWIANIHGGDVRLAASSDRGTTFTAVLPHSG